MEAPSSFSIKVGKFILKVLEKRNLTVNDLAILLGRRKSNVQNMLSGKSNLSIGMISLLEIKLDFKIIITD